MSVRAASVPAARAAREADIAQVIAWRRHSQVFAAMSDAVLVTDLTGAVVDCNPAAERLFGHTRESLLNRPAGIVRGRTDDDERFVRVLAAVRRDGQWSADLSYLGPDGQTRLGATTIVGIYDDIGQLVGTAGISRDVTSERRTASRLAAAEQRWRLTLDGAPSGIALVGLDGRFERVNDALCAMVGYSEQELLARTFQDITHPDDLDADLSMLAQLISGEIPSYTLEKRYFHARGHVVWISLCVGLVSDPDTDEPLHYVSQMQDVTARHRAEARLSAIVASASDAFVGIDSVGTVTEWNAAAERTFGWERGAALGRPVHELIIPPDQREAHLQGLSRVAVGGRAGFLGNRVEVMACGRSGSRFPVELTIWRADESTGEFYAFVRDISVRVRAEHEGRVAAERQAALVEAQLAIADVELTPSKVMQHICDHAERLTGADGAVLEMHDGASMVCLAATRGMAKSHVPRLPVDDSLSGLATESGSALICHDTATDARVNAAACDRLGIRSMVVAPLRHAGVSVGVLKVVSAQPRRFSFADLSALELLAAPFGAAMANARRLETTSQQALTDPLTGLANRTQALHELDRALGRQERHGSHVAVAFIDLDGFKGVNDALGHAKGDRLLVAVADRLRAVVRSTDTPARYGGDEFVIICEGMSQPPDVGVLAARLVDALPGHYDLGEAGALIGASVGVALAESSVPADWLLRAADEAMYEAKRAGGNRWVTRQVKAGG